MEPLQKFYETKAETKSNETIFGELLKNVIIDLPWIVVSSTIDIIRDIAAEKEPPIYFLY